MWKVYYHKKMVQTIHETLHVLDLLCDNKYCKQNSSKLTCSRLHQGLLSCLFGEAYSIPLTLFTKKKLFVESTRNSQRHRCFLDLPYYFFMNFLKLEYLLRIMIKSESILSLMMVEKPKNQKVPNMQMLNLENKRQITIVVLFNVVLPPQIMFISITFITFPLNN